MIQEILHPLSLFSVKLRQYYKEEDMRVSGTGFFVKDTAQQLYLVTNWHIVTGRKPENPAELIPGLKTSPTSLKLNFFEKGTEGKKVITVRKELYKDGKPLWLEHSTYRQKVDLAAIPIGNVPDNAEILTTEHLKLNQEIIIKVGHDIFVIGFPFGIDIGSVLPVWKKGSIASEPMVLIDDLPKFYVDATTRGGMSGAPVFAYYDSSYENTDGETISSIIPPAFKMIGIYSSHVQFGIERPELGIVWHLQALDQLLASPIQGENSYPPIF